MKAGTAMTEGLEVDMKEERGMWERERERDQRDEGQKLPCLAAPHGMDAFFLERPHVLHYSTNNAHFHWSLTVKAPAISVDCIPQHTPISLSSERHFILPL